MGGPNKLLAEIGGKPLVRIAAEQALASRARPVIVVTGHQRERVEAALAGLPVEFVHNPDFAEGLAPRSRPASPPCRRSADGVIVCLGDMPQVDAALIDQLVAALDAGEGRAGRGADDRRPARQSGGLVAPLLHRSDGGRRRHRRAPLIGRYSEAVIEVPLSGKAALTDVDTPEALAAVRAELEKT